MTLKCPMCNSDLTTTLFPGSKCDPNAAGDNIINDSCDILLVCSKCGYLGPTCEPSIDPDAVPTE